MKTSSAKAKGRRLAAKIAQMICDRFGLESDDVRVTPSGCTGEDLWLSPTAQRVFNFAVECKNQEKLNLWASVEQAKGHNLKKPWVLFAAKNRTDPIAVLDAGMFLTLIAIASRLKMQCQGMVSDATTTTTSGTPPGEDLISTSSTVSS